MKNAKKKRDKKNQKFWDRKKIIENCMKMKIFEIKKFRVFFQIEIFSLEIV